MPPHSITNLPHAICTADCLPFSALHSIAKNLAEPIIIPSRSADPTPHPYAIQPCPWGLGVFPTLFRHKMARPLALTVPRISLTIRVSDLLIGSIPLARVERC